jgi:hypothetical protein
MTRRFRNVGVRCWIGSQLVPAALRADRSVMESYSFIPGNSSHSGVFAAQVQFHKNSRLAISATGITMAQF